MITKIQLRELKDSNNHFVWPTEVNWQETSLSRIYEHIDAQIEGGALVDIVSVKPLSFHLERGMMTLEVVLDVTDALEEDEYLGDGE